MWAWCRVALRSVLVCLWAVLVVGLLPSAAWSVTEDGASSTTAAPTPPDEPADTGSPATPTPSEPPEPSPPESSESPSDSGSSSAPPESSVTTSEPESSSAPSESEPSSWSESDSDALAQLRDAGEILAVGTGLAVLLLALHVVSSMGRRG